MKKEIKKATKKKNTKTTKNKKQQQKKPICQIGKFKVTGDTIIWAVLLLLVIIYIFSPIVYSVTTGRYNKGSKEDNANVLNAMGPNHTEERFRLYFQYYNVIHELGHGLIYYNKGVNVPVVEEEQLVNDFAVAYWKYYGEQYRLEDLEDIVNYAVEHVGTNYENGVDYMELGRENSTDSSFDNSFFNFNDYGWFQFSSVKHSFEEDKSLEEVLKEMGMKDFNLGEPKSLIYEEINERTSTKIINDAVKNFRSWGLKFPNATHHYDNNPNNNYSRSMVKFLGLFEVPDYKYIFNRLFK